MLLPITTLTALQGLFLASALARPSPSPETPIADTKTRQHQRIEILRVLRCDSHCLDAAKRMAYPYHILELLAREFPVAKERDKLVDDLDLDRCLHDLDRIRMVRCTNSQPIVGKCGIASLSSDVDVAVS